MAIKAADGAIAGVVAQMGEENLDDVAVASVICPLGQGAALPNAHLV